jgi:hypothetical protein
MELGISFDRSEESLAAKARWFQKLSIEERLEYLDEFYELAVSRNPDLPKKRIVNSTTGRIQILSLE